MKDVLVDTSVFSEELRRKRLSGRTLLRGLIREERNIVLTGIVLQELLSGISDERLFSEISAVLDGFSWIDPVREDHLLAATIRNKLKKNGRAAGTIDCLLSAMALRREMILATYDSDFRTISSLFPLQLLPPIPAGPKNPS